MRFHLRDKKERRADRNDSEDASPVADGLPVTLIEGSIPSSSRRSGLLAIDFTGTISPRSSTSTQRRSDHGSPSMSPTSDGVDGRRRHILSRESSVTNTEESTSSEQLSTLGESTLDVVLDILYPGMQPSRAVTAANDNEMKNRCGSIVQRELTSSLSSSGEDQFVRKSNMTVRCHRSDSQSTTSTIPNPPQLEQLPHYTPLGAFRMTSGGLLQQSDDGADDNDVESAVDPGASYSALEIIEATLVPNQDDDDDDSCAQGYLPPNLCRSMGDGTMMTQVTTGTTLAPIVEALPMDEDMSTRRIVPKKTAWCCGFLLSILFVILGLGTAYGIRAAMLGSLEEPSELDIDVPTGPPTSEGDLNLDYFVNLALPESTRSALKQENSPQSKALRWLRTNSFLQDYPLSRRLQRFALATFYYSTGGERRWANRDGWLSDDDECTWYATTNKTQVDSPCDGIGREVKRLLLSRNDLRGTLPLELSLLSSLEVIDLEQNLVTGLIPTTLGKLSELREIHMFDNFLSGGIPGELQGAAKLEILDVEFNVLRQLIPETLGELKGLRELRLSRNGLQGTLPGYFGKLSLLEIFHVDRNGLTGTIPSTLGTLPQLKSVRWEANRLSGTIPTMIGQWKKVMYLDFGNNTLSGTIPAVVGTLTGLTRLDFFANRLTGTLPSTLGQLTSMDRLYMEQNQLTGNIPTHLGKLKNATRLWLRSNLLSGSLPSELQGMLKLTHLDLSSNQLSGEIPTELGSLSKLEILSLDNNEFTGRIPSSLGSLSNLQTLALQDNALSGFFSRDICLLTYFQDLTNVTVDCSFVICACCRCCQIYSAKECSRCTACLQRGTQQNRNDGGVAAHPCTAAPPLYVYAGGDFAHRSLRQKFEDVGNLVIFVVGQQQQVQFEPYEMNGGSVCAVAGKDFCIVAADTRMSGSGYRLHSRNHIASRLWAVNDDPIMDQLEDLLLLRQSSSPSSSLSSSPSSSSTTTTTTIKQPTIASILERRLSHAPIVVGSSGCTADCKGLQMDLRADLRAARYFLGHSARTMPQQPHAAPAAVATTLSQLLYQRRRFPYYAFCVLAGLGPVRHRKGDDSSDDKGTVRLSSGIGGHVYVYDAIGSYEQVAVAASGTGKEALQPILDGMFESHIDTPCQVEDDVENAILKISQAYRSISEREIEVGDKLILHISEQEKDNYDGTVHCRILIVSLKED